MTIILLFLLLLEGVVTHFQIGLFTVILVFLILLAAFFAFAETALMAVNRYRLRHKARLKKKYAIYLLYLLKRPNRILSVILIGSTFANMIAASIGTLLAHYFWGDKGALIAALLLTLIVLFFAEIVPKTIAAIYPDKVTQYLVYPIKIIFNLLYPVMLFTNALTNGFLKLLRITLNPSHMEPLSREELKSIVYDTSGKLSRQYQNMLLGILDLNKLTVDDVMLPRNEISGIDIELPLETIIAQINQHHQNWIPVYRDNINQIIGVLYTHEVLRLTLSKITLDKELLEHFLQQPYFVPQGTSLNVQLAYFQQSQDKVAFVVDEYGEIQGLLTLNDILEEIIGDFSFLTSKRIQPQPDGSFLVEGAMTVREFNRATDWHLPLGGPRTINGLIIEYLESLPHTGTTILIGKHPIEIIQVKKNRVKLARVFPMFAD